MSIVPNGDKPLLELPKDACEWIQERMEQNKDFHHINAWCCEKCGGLTVCKDIHEGVTPMFLGCRAAGSLEECDGMAVSSGYPSTPPPPHILKKLAWEWYRPSQTEFDKMDEAGKDHVLHGGLNIRKMKV